MPEINGKQVMFYAKMGAAKWWPLLPTLNKLSGADDPFSVLDWPTACKMVTAAIKSWEFDGEPDDVEAIGALDLMSEMVPLIMSIARFIGEKSGQQGNSASGPT